MHRPVLLKEIIEYLEPKNGSIILDATAGCGGHARTILEEIMPNGLLVGIDRDDESLSFARKKFVECRISTYKLIKENFQNFDLVLNKLNVKKVNGILFDLGLSSFQLDNPDRGFSISKNGPLDMRMERSCRLTALEVIQKYPEHKLCEIIKTFGEERYAKRIARYIVAARRTRPIESTSQLAAVVQKAVGYRYRRLRIHPATRTFQAIRIEVNRELEALTEALKKLPYFLARGARVCVISFHSLEDRITKSFFKEYAHSRIFRLINKKPIVPQRDEIYENPRCRSAKMRVAEFTG